MIECPKTSNKNPVKAIRMACKHCKEKDLSAIENCVAETCALYPFRFGTNPFREKREISEEQKARMRENLKKARECKKNS